MKEINFSKSYCATMYCEKICHNCYAFGTNWDIRCNKNRQPINQVVYDCERYKNAKRINDEIIEKMLCDNEFYNFCKVFNNIKSNIKFGCESEFEIFLAIFNENRFSDNRNELKFLNR